MSEESETMFCPKCGKQVKIGTKFCPQCGSELITSQQESDAAPISKSAPIHQTKIQEAQNAKTPLDRFALLGFVFGCISWILNFWGIVGIIAVAFSAVGLSHHIKGTGKVIAIVGMISGIINIFFGLFMLLSI